MVRFGIFCVLFFAAFEAPAQDWQLVWSDEFEESGAPDPTKWTYDIGGHGWGNRELQYYTDRPENARVENGSLVIEARQEDFGGSAYTSARLVTRNRAAWLYGRIEARIKLPVGQGLWPAFWMLPTNSPYGGWPAGGEIDIMEYLAHDTDRVYGTIHSGGGSIGHRFTGTHFTLPAGTFAEDFHTFALEWEPRRMRWYVDEELYQTQISWISAGGPYPAPFDSPFHILLNLAVGGEWPGNPDATTTFPQRMEVDYVRVFQDAAAYPEIVLDEPSDDATVDSGGTVSLAATASDGGMVESVTFLQGEGVLGTDTDEPYAIDIHGVTDGCYLLRARAKDDAGYVSESDSVSIVVGNGCAPGSTWPYLMVPASIPGTVEAEYFDLGGPGAAFLDFSEANEGNGIRQDEGVDIRRSLDGGGGFDVTNIIAREWLEYTIDVAQAGTYRFTARIASGSGGTLRVAVDGEDKFGDVQLPSTGGNTTYATAPLGVTELTAGKQVLRLEMRSAGFSLNRLTVSTVSGTGTEEVPDPGDASLRVVPNPAAASARISYRIPQPAWTEIALYDMTGRRVRELVSEFSTAGEHHLDLRLGGLPSGTYACLLSTAGGRTTALLVVVP